MAALDDNILWESPETLASADDYVFKDGKRMVRPYYFEFLSHVKRRWAGNTIVDVFAREFKGRPPEYYVQAVESGRIQVEGKKVAPSFVVRDSQKVSHFVHRHEPPVMSGPIQVLSEDPDVITVCKPPSVPVHPCGQYRKNTVVGILEAEHNTGKLYPVHRLDRLVSGLLLLARNAKTANLFRQEIEAGRVHKQYVAKVKGVFPAHEVEVSAAVIYDPREGISSVETVQPGSGKGKEACTRFQRLSTNGVSSIVRCEPATGRTHQIRVHLQHIGHPIANDNLYLSAHPPKRSKYSVSADSAARTMATITSINCQLEGSVDCVANNTNAGSEEADQISSRTVKTLMGNIVNEQVALPLPPRCSDTTKTDDLSRGQPAEPTEERRIRNTSEIFTQDVGTMDPVQDSCVGNCVTEPFIGVTEDVQNAITEFPWEGVGNCFPEPLSAKTEDVQIPAKRVPQEDCHPVETQEQEFSVDTMCTHCPNWEPSGYGYGDEGLWLHCVRYACPSWAYECPLPDWATA